MTNTVTYFNGAYVYFCGSEAEAKSFILLPNEKVVGQDNDRPIRRRHVSRIQVMHGQKSKQKSIAEWKRLLGLVPQRTLEPKRQPASFDDIARCMMANGVR